MANNSPFAAVKKLAPPPQIPKDSPFATVAASNSSSAVPAAKTLSGFSFSLGPVKEAAATMVAAAPVVASSVVVVPPVATGDSAKERKITRGRRGKAPRGSHEEDSGHGTWEADGEEGEEGADDDEQGSSSRLGSFTGAPAPALQFDASKFDLNSFVMSLPEPTAVGTVLNTPATHSQQPVAKTALVSSNALEPPKLEERAPDLA